jgi:hypothetical protein
MDVANLSRQALARPTLHNTMTAMCRRSFTRSMMGSLLGVSLLRQLSHAKALQGSVATSVHKWVFALQDASKQLSAGSATQLQWQSQTETIMGQVDMLDVMKAIDYQRLASTLEIFDDHETAEEVSFANIKHLPSELSFAAFFFGMKKGAAIVPHGHSNMVTMHMVLKGEVHDRHFDRIADEGQSMLIAPTVDAMVKPGAVSTISDQRDNIHWFVAQTEPVFMFNIGVYGLDSKAKVSSRDYIDPSRGEIVDRGIRVPKMTAEDAYKKYGKSGV